ncbi:hypothetical protein Fleli_1128 [Bernardetia litoralis DSM 6794]|uniref:Uncharacterized protein n=1 Tax=Bernardetia litoralis (strain ATCC 23117 / DSM 6794 / NBRC 15988 / NCIMB 1366 / Fx l1 / Sio-4) TaxID=880071 RepID=I4AHY1_BERLS|nr:hypothetical protein [Bernardetia litoralis]AFM03566.1 hypothetical protein Fleli_1128 [Bernardetia litoralis DSM 6794]
MRKLFLASMLTLGMAGAAFANNNKTEVTSEIITPKIEVIQVKQTVQKKTKKVKSCFDFGFSCGGSVNICNFGATTMELMSILWEFDNQVCGG